MAAMQRAHATSFGVEAITESSLKDNPFCDHGPTLLFERFYGKGESRKFYACSACRDRKQCAFFHWQDEKFTKAQQEFQSEIRSKLLIDQEEAGKVKCLKTEDYWCFDCNIGFKEKKGKPHASHSTKQLIQEDLLNPSLFLSPKENNKSNAQFFFDESTCKFLINAITKLQYDRVVCIGAPRLFELLQQEQKTSILLDIDKRYAQFYSPEQFLQFNMFNGFFFNHSNGERLLHEFICNGEPEKMLLIIDPPFGGLVNVLAKILKDIWKLGPIASLNTMLIFPYFLESHVLQSLPSFNMLDYKVGYSNHTVYNNSGKNVRGSPVRIFTNIKADEIQLPKDKYRFCKFCKKHVYKENRHCKLCKSCTSKDGRTYVHCDKCEKCVKPGRVHCEECNQCLPENHKCSENVKTSSCHICGENDHKRRDCPQRKNNATSINGDQSKKRKSQARKSKTPKKKIRL